jgi:glycosyltransferase involved in cell wall biosynthesis
MDPEHERQTETVFYAALKRRNAWLESERTAVPPPTLNASPLVSIITPVYNRASFVDDAIASVQRSTLADWEHIVVDNGSTDGTREVVRKLAASDSRIRLIENDRNIIAFSLNLALRHARGKYVSQLDSDDEYLPHTLQSMVDALDTHPTWALAISYYELMDEVGRSLPDFGIIKHLEYNRNNILRVDGAGAVRCWHRSVIEEMGGFNEKDFPNYGEDYDLVLKVSERYEIGRVHEICYRYRRHEGNTDMLRDPLTKLRSKTLARESALKRRRKLNQGIA